MEKKNIYIKNLITRMSLEQKIGAMLTLGFSGVVPKANIYKYIEEYHCGGLRLETSMRQFGNYVDPKNNTTVVKIENKTGIRFKTNAPACTASQYKSVLAELHDPYSGQSQAGGGYEHPRTGPAHLLFCFHHRPPVPPYRL